MSTRPNIKYQPPRKCGRGGFFMPQCGGKEKKL
nr:MAG TPA: hypothetical protein [Bacteriophage sp.]